MIFLDAASLSQTLPIADAIAAIEGAFRAGNARAPLRHHHELSAGRELLLMPAWDHTGLGIKSVTLSPDGVVIAGWYVLMDEHGAPQAMIDGAALTTLRTAAVSGAATRALARAESEALVLFGAGSQARAHAIAMRAVRPVQEVSVVSRSPGPAQALVEELAALGIAARVAAADAVARADLVCCCTTAGEPLFDGELLARGTHINVIGTHLPVKREVDATAVARSTVFVETREAALAEAGDLLLAEAEGRWSRDAIAGELSDVIRGRVARRAADEITLFKSVGLATEDLAVARAAYERAVGELH